MFYLLRIQKKNYPGCQIRISKGLNVNKLSTFYFIKRQKFPLKFHGNDVLLFPIFFLNLISVLKIICIKETKINNIIYCILIFVMHVFPFWSIAKISNQNKTTIFKCTVSFKLSITLFQNLFKSKYLESMNSSR